MSRSGNEAPGRKTSRAPEDEDERRSKKRFFRKVEVNSTISPTGGKQKSFFKEERATEQIIETQARKNKDCSSEEEHRTNALASGAEEGRD